VFSLAVKASSRNLRGERFVPTAGSSLHILDYASLDKARDRRGRQNDRTIVLLFHDLVD
jgi:hypothetical protein